MEDGRIVELYLNKEEQALTESAQKYGRKLRGIAYGILRNFSDAEECENDTYLSAWNSIPPHEPRNYLFAFLGKITRNLSINLYNKHHTQKRYGQVVELTQEMEACIPSPSDAPCMIEDDDLMEAINAFLSLLSKEERSVFVARYWYGDSVKEVAQRFVISESKTKSMLMRTRNKMRKYFQDKEIKL